MAISMIIELTGKCDDDMNCQRCVYYKDTTAIGHEVCHFFCQEYTDFINDLYARYSNEAWNAIFQTEQLASGRQYWSSEQTVKIVAALVLANVQMSKIYWFNKLDKLFTSLLYCIEKDLPMYLDYDV